LTLVETFEITGPLADYKQTVTAFCHKIEQDGLADVLVMQFYVSQDVREAYLILTLKDGDAFDKHAAFIMSTDEVRPYVKTVRLKQMRAFGAMNADTVKRLGSQHGFDFEWVSEHVTGFIRSGAPGSE